MSRQLHASEVGGERGPELRSAAEQSPLEEFLATAELAGTRFVAGEELDRVLGCGWARRGAQCRAGADPGLGRGARGSRDRLRNGAEGAGLGLVMGSSGWGAEAGLGTAGLGGYLSLPAERLNIQIVSAQSRTGLLTAQEAQRVQQLHQENRHFLRIPRR